MPRKRASTPRSVSAEPARADPPRRPRNGTLWYNGEEADRVVQWFRDRLVHTEGLWAGRPFILAPWQEFEIVRLLFGWMRWDRQWGIWVRRYSKAQIWLPRGNGKSELAAAIELFLLDADGEAGAEVYIAAEDREQAGIVYRVAAQMVRLSPTLSKRLTPIDSTKRIISVRTNSFLVALPRDNMGTGAQGFKVHGAVVDELHVQKRRELLEAIEKGMGKRAQPLFLTITTAGNDPANPEAEDYAYAKAVLTGREVNPNLFVYIREAPPECDPFDEANWFLANPALGDFLSLETLRQEAREAKSKPSKRNPFLQFRLNIHTRQVERYIPMEAWDAQACIQMVDELDLRGRQAYGGLDVGAPKDMAAFVLVVPDDAEHEPASPTDDRPLNGFDVICRFWIPGDEIDERGITDGAPYQEWADDGRLKLTEGNTMDHAAIRDEVLSLGERYDIFDVGYRPVGAAQIAPELTDQGVEMVPILATHSQMSDATEWLLELILTGRLRHGGHPILRRMADALAVKSNSDGDVKPDTQASGANIAGMLALIRALDRALRNTAQEPGIRILGA